MKPLKVIDTRCKTAGERLKRIYLIGLLVSSQMGILRLGTCLLQGATGPEGDGD